MRLVLISFVMVVASISNADESSSGYAYTQCSGWNYGYSGTFSCSGFYHGATRSCQLIEDGSAIAFWNEEGCATGVSAGSGYCVGGCR